MLDITIPLTPVAKGRPRVTRKGIAYTPSKTRKAEQDMRYYLSMAWKRPPSEDPLRILAVFVFPRPKSVSEKKRPFHTVKPDIDNCLKLLKDAGNGIIWRDDSQICEVICAKGYAKVGAVRLCVARVE